MQVAARWWGAFWGAEAGVGCEYVSLDGLTCPLRACLPLFILSAATAPALRPCLAFAPHYSTCSLNSLFLLPTPPRLLQACYASVVATATKWFHIIDTKGAGRQCRSG